MLEGLKHKRDTQSNARYVENLTYQNIGGVVFRLIQQKEKCLFALLFFLLLNYDTLVCLLDDKGLLLKNNLRHEGTESRLKG